MERWFVYVYERFPALIYGSLALGVSLSGSNLNRVTPPFFSTLLVFIGVWIFLFSLCLGNDIKDFTKDKVAFPERPLPQGKIKLVEAKQLLFFIQLFLFAYSQIIWIFVGSVAALFYLILACWSWVVCRGFFVKSLFDRFPFFQTLLSSLFIFPMVFFAVAAAQPLRVFGVKSWAFAATLYGALLTYRLCCTINPHLHPITAGFIHFYGFRKTFYFAVAGLIISAVAGVYLSIGPLLFPIELIVLGSLALQFYDRDQYRVVEMAAVVSLIVHAWSGIF